MINGLEGIPGSGKSYEAVVMHVLPTLRQGRKVITNLPLLVAVFASLDHAFGDLIELRTKSMPVLGIWDAEGVDTQGNGEAFKLADVRHFDAIKNVPVFGSVWDYYSDWKHPVNGLGPLFVIDEAHLALPAVNTNQEVIEWYKLHRHFNADVLLATQSFRDINQPIARLLGMLIKCRKADILGKKDSYIRKVYSGYRGAVLSAEERKYEPQYFSFYRSHTQGNSVAESIAGDVAPLYVKLKRFTRWFWAFTLVACLAFVWWYMDRKSPKTTTTTTTTTGPPAGFLPSPAPLPPKVVSGPPAAPAAGILGPLNPPEKPDLEPLATKAIHIVGFMAMGKKTVHTFAVSSAGARQFELQTADLATAGYTFRPMGSCMGYLLWGEKTRIVTCDAPALTTGSGNGPVVMDFGTGKRTDAPIL